MRLEPALPIANTDESLTCCAKDVDRTPPGVLRDLLFEVLAPRREGLQVKDIEELVRRRLPNVASSSIRSYLNSHVGSTFERPSRGLYRLANLEVTPPFALSDIPSTRIENARLFNCDSLDWLRARETNSIHAVVTDPPYGLVEYSEKEKMKLRRGQGGVWRIPPSFDGAKRSALPRFTTLTDKDIDRMTLFFTEFAVLLNRVVVPGANVLIATNPLLTHVIATAMAAGGLEVRGQISRLVMTMRGGDRPKGAHNEFPDVSVMPRSQHEPWIVLRKPLEGTVAANLRKWGTGGFRRISADQPFGDVIQSSPTRAKEKALAPHPSLKPQALMRHLVRGVLPNGTGYVLDPFAGSGSTLAAANVVGYESIGIELDADYYALAAASIPKLQSVEIG